MRALIVADCPVSAASIRRGLRDAAIRAAGDLYVDADRPCTSAVRPLEPHVVIIDETRSPENALERIAELRALLPAVKIVMLSSLMDAAWLERATAAGIDAAIRKTPNAISLGALVREVSSGNVFHSFAPPSAQMEPTRLTDLTARELEILCLAAAGAPNGVIGAQLWITEQTVKFHLSNVYRKLGVANRTQASRYVYENGLFERQTATSVAPKAA